MAKRVFLAFSEDDAAAVSNLLENLTHLDYDLDFYDGQLPQDFESEEAVSVRRKIGEKIVNCNVTVCLIGENTHKSKWVDCCLQKSRNKGNKIIAMALKKVESASLPEIIKEENLTFYPWNPHKLTELICR
jgi:hypothetical protein